MGGCGSKSVETGSRPAGVEPFESKESTGKFSSKINNSNSDNNRGDSEAKAPDAASNEDSAVNKSENLSNASTTVGESASLPTNPNLGKLILPTASADAESVKGAAQTMRNDNNASAFFDSTGGANASSFSSIPIVAEKREEVKPRAGTRSILHLERTSKFSAFCLRIPGHHAHIATPNARPKSVAIMGSTAAAELSTKLLPSGMLTPSARHRPMSQQISQKMIGDLRSTLHRLNTLKNSPGKRAQLIRLDSSGMNHLCCLCKKKNIKGLMCEKDHFTCLDCFGPHVEKVCKDTKVLRKDNFGIHCPLRMCDSACWNSYHVRKVLDGPSLEMYIDTLVTMCREEEIRHAPMTTAAVHLGSETYQVETLEVLRNQIKELNLTPLEYIPLEDINSELQDIFDRLNNDMDYDEARMEFLLMCMKQNPEYIAEEEAKNRRWREEMAVYTSECLQIMRGYVPPHVFEATLQSLQEDDGFPKELAKRLLSKKCLWLIRMNAWDIERIHEVELMGRFNPVAQGLDIVEMSAIFASVPEKFLNDPTGRKTEWRNNFETSLKDMDKKRRNNALKGNAMRNSAYKKLPVGPFIKRTSMRKMEVTGGIDSEIQAE